MYISEYKSDIYKSRDCTYVLEMSKRALIRTSWIPPFGVELFLSWEVFFFCFFLHFLALFGVLGRYLNDAGGYNCHFGYINHQFGAKNSQFGYF